MYPDVMHFALHRMMLCSLDTGHGKHTRFVFRRFELLGC
jgi:hypothetical protein